MNIENIKSDRDAIEILIQTQLYSFLNKYQIRKLDVTITPVTIDTIGREEPVIVSFDVKINVSI